MFDNRSERERGQERQRADENHRANQQHDEREAAHGKVPALAGTIFLRASDPASASSGTIMPNRPSSMSNASVVSYHGVLALRPAKALPLLPAPEV